MITEENASQFGRKITRIIDINFVTVEITLFFLHVYQRHFASFNRDGKSML